MENIGDYTVDMKLHNNYNIITDSLEFEWDPAKDRINIAKHGVSFADATEVFDDIEGLTSFDPAHSDYEERYLTLGLSKTGVLLMVSFCVRGNRLRIISARKATKNEAKEYRRKTGSSLHKR